MSKDLPYYMPLLPSEERRTLTPAETRRRKELEQTIARGVMACFEMSMALEAMQEERLFLSTHPTFEAYCKDLWEISRIRAYQLIAAVKVIKNLRGEDAADVNHGLHYEQMVSSSDIILPANERQCRPLTLLPTPDQQREAWKWVLDTAPDGRITAGHVARVVRSFIKGEIKEKVKDIQRRIARDTVVSMEFKTGFQSLWQVVHDAKEEGWKKTTKQAALKYVDELRAVIEAS